jgi:hypothetical protein
MFFRSIIRLLPSAKKEIPIMERWECRDFKIQNSNNINKYYNYKNFNDVKIGYNKKIEYKEQHETRDF